MKNFKKMTAVLLSVVMMLGIFAVMPIGVGTVKAETDDTSTEEQVIYFDFARSGWEDVETVYCHIWAADGSSTTNTGGSWNDWQTKKEHCTYDEDTGIAAYKLSKVDNNFSADDGKIYCVIFSADSGQQTFDTIMSGSCIGDSVYCDDEPVENPLDSQKTCYLTKWESNADCGAVKVITSLGNVVGTANAEGVTDADLFASYMINYCDDEAKMANVQSIIDNELLSFTKEQAEISLAKKLENSADWDEKMATVTAILDDCTFDDSASLSIVIFDEQAYRIGDVNFDWVIDINDVRLIISHVVGKTDFTDEQKYCADINRDGEVSIQDVIHMQNMMVDGKADGINSNVGKKINIGTGEIIDGSSSTDASASGTAEQTTDAVPNSSIEATTSPTTAEQDKTDISLGDVNKDGSVDISDATAVQKAVAQITSLTEAQQKAADMNGNGSVDISDATMIQKFAAKIISSFTAA